MLIADSFMAVTAKMVSVNLMAHSLLKDQQLCQSVTVVCSLQIKILMIIRDDTAFVTCQMFSVQ